MTSKDVTILTQDGQSGANVHEGTTTGQGDDISCSSPTSPISPDSSDSTSLSSIVIVDHEMIKSPHDPFLESQPLGGFIKSHSKDGSISNCVSSPCSHPCIDVLREMNFMSSLSVSIEDEIPLEECVSKSTSRESEYSRISPSWEEENVKYSWSYASLQRQSFAFSEKESDENDAEQIVEHWHSDDSIEVHVPARFTEDNTNSMTNQIESGTFGNTIPVPHAGSEMMGKQVIARDTDSINEDADVDTSILSESNIASISTRDVEWDRMDSIMIRFGRLLSPTTSSFREGTELISLEASDEALLALEDVNMIVQTMPEEDEDLTIGTNEYDHSVEDLFHVCHQIDELQEQLVKLRQLIPAELLSNDGRLQELSHHKDCDINCYDEAMRGSDAWNMEDSEHSRSDISISSMDSDDDVVEEVQDDDDTCWRFKLDDEKLLHSCSSVDSLGREETISIEIPSKAEDLYSNIEDDKDIATLVLNMLPDILSIIVSDIIETKKLFHYRGKLMCLYLFDTLDYYSCIAMDTMWLAYKATGGKGNFGDEVTVILSRGEILFLKVASASIFLLSAGLLILR